jgi:hypothetical protein
VGAEAKQAAPSATTTAMTSPAVGPSVQLNTHTLAGQPSADPARSVPYRRGRAAGNRVRAMATQIPENTNGIATNT